MLRQSWRTLGAIILGAMALLATGWALARTDTTAAPEAPEILQATRYGNRTITMRWDAPRSGGSPILKYQIRHARGETPTGEWTDVTGGEQRSIIHLPESGELEAPTPSRSGRSMRWAQAGNGASRKRR